MAEVVPRTAPGLFADGIGTSAPGWADMPGSSSTSRYGLDALVDQHSHGVLHAALGLRTFETHLAAAVVAGSGVAGSGEEPPGGALLDGASPFDSRTGLDVRRWCPPLLGLEAALLARPIPRASA